MPRTVKLRNGEIRIVATLEDALDIIDACVGPEVLEYIQALDEDNKDRDRINEDLIREWESTAEYNRDIAVGAMYELRAISERLRDELNIPRLNRDRLDEMLIAIDTVVDSISQAL